MSSAPTSSALDALPTVRRRWTSARHEFVDLEKDVLEDVGEVDLVFDVIGGDIGKRSARLIRAGGTLVTIVGPTEARPVDGTDGRLRCPSPIAPS